MEKLISPKLWLQNRYNDCYKEKTSHGRGSDSWVDLPTTT